MLLKGMLLLVMVQGQYKPEAIHPALTYLGFGDVLGIPAGTIVLILMCLICTYLINKIRPIRNVYAVGGNEEGARMMGINVTKTRFIAHMLCGLFCAFAGINYAARLGGTNAAAGEQSVLLVIAAIVIGGIKMEGGQGRIYHALLGSLVITTLSTIFTLQEYLNSFWEQTVIGVMLLIVLLFQYVRLPKRSKLSLNKK
jgi:ribose transport system permease protein